MTVKRARAWRAADNSSAAKRRTYKERVSDPPRFSIANGMPGMCWCGQPYPHDWPGKDNKQPHPREDAT